MKKLSVFLFFLLAFSAFAESTIDINVTYEGSQMKVKETVCGWVPDLEKGYAADENGCYYTVYRLNQPLYGYSFTPKAGPMPEETRAAYYIAFYDSTIPDEKKLHEYVMEDGKKLREIQGLFHDRIMQGVAMLKKGEYLNMTSDKEPPYIYIYAATLIIVALGIFFIIRRKK